MLLDQYTIDLIVLLNLKYEFKYILFLKKFKHTLFNNGQSYINGVNSPIS